MTDADLERLWSELASIRDELRQLAASRELPRVLTIAQAARELSIGLTTLRAMMRTGRIATTGLIGGRKLIPLSEVLRLSAPEPTRPTTRRRPLRPTRWTPIAK